MDSDVSLKIFEPSLKIRQLLPKMFKNTPLLIVLSNLSTVLPFLSATAMLFFSRSIRNTILLWLFFTAALLTEILVHAHHLANKPNAWIIHLYTPLEYLLIVFILSRWQNREKSRKAMLISIPLYLGLYGFMKIAGIENLESSTINYVSRPISLLLIGGFVLFTLHQLSAREETLLQSDYRFWILLALAIYYCGSIIIVPFMYIQNREILLFLVYTHAILNILQNLLFVIGNICALGLVSPLASGQDKTP